MITKAALLTLRNNDSELLFVRPKGKKHFLFPGGKLEAGETVAQALEREIDEELGVQVRDVQKIGVCTGKTPDGRDLEMHLFVAQMTGEPSAQAEIAQLYWLKRDDLTRYDSAITPITREQVLPLLKAKNIW